MYKVGCESRRKNLNSERPRSIKQSVVEIEVTSHMHLNVLWKIMYRLNSGSQIVAGLKIRKKQC